MKPNLFLRTQTFNHQHFKLYKAENPKLIKFSYTHYSAINDEKKICDLIQLLRNNRNLQSTYLSFEDLSNIGLKCICQLLHAISKSANQNQFVFKSFFEPIEEKSVIQFFLQSIRRMKRLKKIQFMIPLRDKNYSCENVFSTVSKLRLTHLDLEFLEQKGVSIAMPISIPNFCKYLSRMTYIKFLKIDLNDITTQNELAVKLFSKCVSNLPTFSKFSLGLDEDMELASLISCIPTLKRLELRSINGKTSGFGFLNIAENLEKITTLLTLVLDIDGIEKATEPTAENFAETIANIETMRSLILISQKPSSSNNMKLKRFFQFLPEINTLRRLHINLFKTLSSKVAINEISKGIKTQKYLEDLTLMLQECGLTDIELSAIADSISDLGKIKFFKISIRDNWNIICPGIVELLKSLRDLNNLTSLYLDFTGIKQLSDQNMKGFLEILSKHNKIISLALLLSSCRGLTDEWIIKLSDSLRNQQNLKRILLTFTECQSITDKGFLRLIKSISNFKQLDQLGLGIEHCDITNKGMEGLRELVESLKMLNYLQLKLPGFRKISYHTVTSIGSVLKNLKRLKRVSMDQYPFSASKEEPSVSIEDCSTGNMWEFLQIQ